MANISIRKDENTRKIWAKNIKKLHTDNCFDCESRYTTDFAGSPCLDCDIYKELRHLGYLLDLEVAERRYKKGTLTVPRQPAVTAARDYLVLASMIEADFDKMKAFRLAERHKIKITYFKEALLRLEKAGVMKEGF